MATPSLSILLSEIRTCRTCEAHLPHGIRPIVRRRSLLALVFVLVVLLIPANGQTGTAYTDWALSNATGGDVAAVN